MKIEALDVRHAQSLRILIEEDILKIHGLGYAEAGRAFTSIQWMLELEKRLAAAYEKQNEPPKTKQVRKKPEGK